MLFTGYHLVENMQNLSKIFITTFWSLRKGGKNHKRTVQKDLTDPFSHSGVVTHLETDILKCEVKWALGSITMNKARGGDGIPIELFQIPKDDSVKVLHSICQQMWKNQQWPQDWKRSVFIPIPRKSRPKNVQITVQLHSFHMLARLCPKFLKLVFNSTRTSRCASWKTEEPEINLPTSTGL